MCTRINAKPSNIKIEQSLSPDNNGEILNDEKTQVLRESSEKHFTIAQLKVSILKVLYN